MWCGPWLDFNRQVCIVNRQTCLFKERSHEHLPLRRPSRPPNRSRPQRAAIEPPALAGDGLRHALLPGRLQCTDAALPCLPGDVALLQRDTHAGIRLLRAGPSRRAAGLRAAQRPRRPQARDRSRHVDASGGDGPVRDGGWRVRALRGAHVQGLATGAAIGAIGAAMLDIDRERGTSPTQWRLHWVRRWADSFPACWRTTCRPRHCSSTRSSLRCTCCRRSRSCCCRNPDAPCPAPGPPCARNWRCPRSVRPALRAAVPVLVAGWAMAGFYASLGPALVHHVFGFDASLGGGIALFLLAGSAGVSVCCCRRSRPNAW